VAIAKFRRKDDEINTVVWERIAFALAEKAGIAVPLVRLEATLRAICDVLGDTHTGSQDRKSVGI
jgi:hypothetical protein